MYLCIRIAKCFGLLSFHDLSCLGFASVFLIVLYVVFFEVGLGSIPWLIGAEIFPEKIRSKAIAASSAINWCCNFIVGLCFPWFNRVLGDYCFVPFGVFLCGSFVIQYFTVPETQGKSLEQIQQEIKL